MTLKLVLANQLAEIPKALAELEACAVQQGIAEQAVFSISLALDELLTNVISHGFAAMAQPHTITVLVHCDAETLSIEVVDDGQPFNPLHDAPPPDLSSSLEERRLKGLGVHIVRKMVDQLAYHRAHGHNHVTLTKQLPNPRSDALLELQLKPELAEIPRMIDAVEAFLTAHDTATKLIFGITLSLDELLTNAISHGFQPDRSDQEITVRLRLAGEQLIIELLDNGLPFDPLQQAPLPDLEASIEERRVGGLGIHLVKKMVDEIDYHRKDGHNHLRLRKMLK